MARRPINEMPKAVEAQLRAADVMADYEDRPHYQRNEYLGWIANTKRPETRRKRINQMIDELRRGGVYMNMSHPPSVKA